jgi:hypothetical protein
MVHKYCVLVKVKSVSNKSLDPAEGDKKFCENIGKYFE